MPCPCGRSQDYAECCQPLHTGSAKAKTAEQLMRSRYAAYVEGVIDCLVETTHPKTCTADLRAGYQRTHDSIQWVGLEVVSTFQGGETDKTGKVEFKASYIQDGQSAVHHERSRFKRHSGDWFYLDGDVADG